MSITMFDRRIEKLTKFIYGSFGKIILPIDTNGVEILANMDFQNSLSEVKNFTLLDTDRLANLWNYCLLSNPNGAIYEIGSYKGGGALHLSNSQPNRPIYIFDSFEGFAKVDPKLDSNFNLSQFKDTSIKGVNFLFEKKKRRYQIVNGFFPQSIDASTDILPASFVHLDVDVYDATLDSLVFLDKIMLENSFILIDDYQRNCKGVDAAIEGFIKTTDNWKVFPLFPSQALLIHNSWFK